MITFSTQKRKITKGDNWNGVSLMTLTLTLAACLVGLLPGWLVVLFVGSFVHWFICSFVGYLLCASERWMTDSLFTGK